MSGWCITYLAQARKDLQALDHSQQGQVIKAIKKVSTNPLPVTEGRLGKPLGRHSGNNLTGYMKIKLLRLGLRVVYRLVRENGEMNIVVVSVRDDDTVYRIVKQRMNL